MSEITRRTGYFDERGVCQLIANGGEVPEGFAYSAPVKEGLRPNDVWFNPATGRVNLTRDVEVTIPASIGVGQALELELPPDTVAIVDGEMQSGTLKIVCSEARKVSIELFGRQRGSFVLEARTYVEERAAAYAPIEEQLDMLYHDPEAWRAHVAAVKAEFPKDQAE